MMNKKILIIGMVDSIHLSRWLKQFEETNLTFVIYPSRKFRSINSELKKLLMSNSKANFKFITICNSKFLTGYLDYVYFEILSKLIPKIHRAKKMARLLEKEKFDYIHSVEIQSAGYLLNDISEKVIGKSKIIVTNWGSDIYYFRKFPEHSKQITRVLSIAHFYSAECKRDYDLAREFGFKGIELPCIPNAGGFKLEQYRNKISPTSKRNQICIKGYGGIFGRADIPLNLIIPIALEFPNIRFFIYSVTKDILPIISNFPVALKSRIKVSTIRDRLSNDQILDEFLKSRIYLGSSESDGISTSFLQALITGTFPIQTNTSCASEWISRGANASIIPLDSTLMYNKIRGALLNDQMVDNASEINFKVARKYLDYEVVKKKAFKFYGIAN